MTKWPFACTWQGGMRPLLFILIVGACGGSQPQLVGRQPKTWADHITEAEQHEENAIAHERAVAEADGPSDPAAYACGDTVLNDQLTSGGEQLTSWMPCWDLAEESAIGHRALARKERAAAKEDREMAASLARTERQYCRGIPDRELSHSPFAHQKAIAQIIPHRQSGEIHGVRIVFKPVPGLTAGYMTQAIACQRARYLVLGKPVEQPEDPTLLDGAEVTVTTRDGHLEVLVWVESAVDGSIALARARELLQPRTAER